MKSRPRRPTASLTVACVALVVAIGGSAVAAVGAIPADGRFTACYQTSESILNRVVLLAEADEQCPPSYARVTWPAQASGGAAGSPGPQGPAGPQGPVGPAGPRGPAASSSTSTLQIVVVRRSIGLRGDDGSTIARCPKGFGAVGGGSGGLDGRHQPKDSHPLVENGVPVGWSFRSEEKRRFKIFENVPQTTGKGGFPEHRHQYFLGPFLIGLEPLGNRSPASGTVYALCVRLKTLQVAKPRQPGGGTRNG